MAQTRWTAAEGATVTPQCANGYEFYDDHECDILLTFTAFAGGTTYAREAWRILDCADREIGGKRTRRESLAEARALARERGLRLRVFNRYPR